jgi:hypothetical protein
MGLQSSFGRMTALAAHRVGLTTFFQNLDQQPAARLRGHLTSNLERSDSWRKEQ